MDLNYQDYTSTTESRIIAIPVVDDIEKDQWQYTIDKTWTYGDIGIVLALILIIFILVWRTCFEVFKTKYYRYR